LPLSFIPIPPFWPDCFAKYIERLTYTWELDATVTALWCGSLLLEVEVTELATWGLDNADLVGGGVIPIIVRVSRVSMPSSSSLD
jgi:hypothetical protein